MSQFKSKQFVDLKNKWYKKLEKSGFEDIEKDEYNFKWSAESQALQSLRNNGETGQKNIQDYYRLAGFFYNDYKFKSKKDKKIWEYHSQGISVRNISELLTKQNIKIATTQVQETINKLRKIMIKKTKNE